ncbi:LolA family protein [Natrialba swarupiae]|uniref:Outer membrane lipoprotein carrier protein LolA n=1 Tax=Natrialba swarupiae TaxID=2448032 RepID=A0A5D5AV75_9EURY|nr:outer membrane lipoprotein carrier protein LolA [Natrialba swarupiae]TYT63001.1 outer membrane lipoprotein carrier protein LolA [Natrialba swarupiae]
MPSSPRYRRSLPIVVLVVALLTAGCVAVPGDSVTGEEIADRLENDEVPSEVSATLEVRTVVDGETTQYEEDVWLREEGTTRIETGDGDLIVSDGDRRWHHEPETDSVQYIEVDPDSQSMLEGLYGQQERYLTDDSYALSDVEETTLDGRETYRLAFDPPEDETIERSIDVLVGDTEYTVPLETSEHDVENRHAERVEVWLDRETLFPVSHRVVGDSAELETTYTDLEIEPGLEDDLFEFDPSSESDEANGEIDDGGDGDEFEAIVLPSIEEFESVDEADETVSFPVGAPDPDALPDGVERNGVSRYEFPDENRTQVSVFYRGANGTVSTTTSDGPRTFATGGESIEIGTATGSIATTDEGTELQWSCEDRYYSVFADDAFGDDVAVDLAESIADGCP